jgi:hypothetical protein
VCFIFLCACERERGIFSLDYDDSTQRLKIGNKIFGQVEIAICYLL